MRVEELALPLDGCSTYEGRLCSWPGQHSRGGPGGGAQASQPPRVRVWAYWSHYSYAVRLCKCRANAFAPCHLLVERTDCGVMRAGEISLSLMICTTWENWLRASPGKHNGYDTEGKGMGESAQRVWRV